MKPTIAAATDPPLVDGKPDVVAWVIEPLSESRQRILRTYWEVVAEYGRPDKAEIEARLGITKSRVYQQVSRARATMYHRAPERAQAIYRWIYDHLTTTCGIAKARDVAGSAIGAQALLWCLELRDHFLLEPLEAPRLETRSDSDGEMYVALADPLHAARLAESLLKDIGYPVYLSRMASLVGARLGEDDWPGVGDTEQYLETALNIFGLGHVANSRCWLSIWRDGLTRHAAIVLDEAGHPLATDTLVACVAEATGRNVRASYLVKAMRERPHVFRHSAECWSLAEWTGVTPVSIFDELPDKVRETLEPLLLYASTFPEPAPDRISLASEDAPGIRECWTVIRRTSLRRCFLFYNGRLRLALERGGQELLDAVRRRQHP